MNNLKTFEEFFWTDGKFYFPWQKPPEIKHDKNKGYWKDGEWIEKEKDEDEGSEEDIDAEINNRSDIDPYNEENWDDKEKQGYWIGNSRIYCPRCGSGNISSDKYELLICNDCSHIFGD